MDFVFKMENTLSEIGKLPYIEAYKKFSELLRSDVKFDLSDLELILS